MEKIRSYKIADDIITLDWSRSKVMPIIKSDRLSDGFICKERRKPDISISLEYGYLPNIKKERVFKSGTIWRLSRSDNKYIYEKIDDLYKEGVSQRAIFDKDFRQGSMFFASNKMKKDKKTRDSWNLSYIMTNFMQILLLNFLAHNQEGLLTHSSSLRHKGINLTFFGKQEAGKSTMTKLWNESSNDVEIFNDDRCIIKRKKDKFKIYSTPWPGSFDKYELTHNKADIDYAYFIYHSKLNKIEKLSSIKAFGKIMQNIFPPFWSEGGMKFILSFCNKFAKEVDCYELGFQNNKNIVTYLKRYLNGEVSCEKFSSFKKEQEHCLKSSR